MHNEDQGSGEESGKAKPRLWKATWKPHGLMRQRLGSNIPMPVAMWVSTAASAFISTI